MATKRSGQKAADAIRAMLKTKASNIDIAKRLRRRYPKVDSKYVAWYRWKGHQHA